MSGMKEIREHIESVRSTQKVTNAMYLIASTKMRRAKEDLAKTRPFFDALSGEIEHIFQHAGAIESPYFYNGNADDLRQPGTYAYLIITADRGLAGAYNQNVIQETLRRLEKHPDSRLLSWAATDVIFSPPTVYRWRRVSITARRAPRCSVRVRSRQRF